MHAEITHTRGERVGRTYLTVEVEIREATNRGNKQVVDKIATDVADGFFEVFVGLIWW